LLVVGVALVAHQCYFWLACVASQSYYTPLNTPALNTVTVLAHLIKALLVIGFALAVLNMITLKATIKVAEWNE